MSKLYAQCPTFYLAGSGVIIGATSITLTSFTDIYGNVLTMANFGDTGYITLEPDTTNEESATFTGVTANANGTWTLTGVKTVLATSPYTQTSGLIRQHSGGTKLVVTDTTAFWATFPNKSNSETITGVWTVPTGGTGSQIATATDIAAAVSGASGTATNLVNGTSKLSVAAVSAPSPIVVGDNDPRVPTQGENDALVGDNTEIAVGTGNKLITQTGLIKGAEKYALSTGSANAYVITLPIVVTSYTPGMEVNWTANFSNSSSATGNVNGLGAKTIKLPDGTSNIPANYILSGGTVKTIYDGTNLVIQTPNATIPFLGLYKNGTTTKDSADASTTQNIPHGLGVIPKMVDITALAVAVSTNPGSPVIAQTTYNGTTQSSVSVYPNSNTPSLTTVSTFTINTTFTGSGNSQTGVVTFDATNIIITWTKTASPTGIYTLLWKATA